MKRAAKIAAVAFLSVTLLFTVAVVGARLRVKELRRLFVQGTSLHGDGSCTEDLTPLGKLAFPLIDTRPEPAKPVGRR